MKQLLLLITLLISTASFAQIISRDEKDDFTDVHIINVSASKTKNLSLDDNISDNKKGDLVILGFAIEKKTKSKTEKAIILSIISDKSKCYYGNELLLLFNNGERLSLKQTTKSICDTAAVIGYDIQDDALNISKNNILKKIRVTNSNGHTDYTIDPEKQEIIKETLELAYSKYQELQQ